MQKILKTLVYFFITLIPLCIHCQQSEFSVLYQGRFRPDEVYAKLWLSDLYHKQSLKAIIGDQTQGHNLSAINFLLNLHVMGHQHWDNFPLFWVKSAEIKRLAGLELKKERFSYQDLHDAIYLNPQTSPSIAHLLLTYEFLQAYFSPSNHAKTERFEVKNFSPGLWVQIDNSNLVISEVPAKTSWPFFKIGQVIAESVLKRGQQLLDQKKPIIDELLSIMGKLHLFEKITGQKLSREEAFESRFKQLLNEKTPPKKIAALLENEYPLNERLKSAGTLFISLPGKYRGEWYSLNAFKVKVYSQKENRLLPVSNFTPYDDFQFEELRKIYFKWEKSLLDKEDTATQNQLFEEFSSGMHAAYQTIAGTIYQTASGKALKYPSQFQLQTESIYYRYPWIEILVLLYVISTIFLFFSYSLRNHKVKKIAMFSLSFAFLLHTLLLSARSFILSRPPVSNMFETVIYVPWVAVAVGLLFNLIRTQLLLLIASCLASIFLLLILKLTDLNHHLENVQAVLDSQFWLMIHVLMIVGSYGIFILSGILAHLYLLYYLFTPKESGTLHALAQSVIKTLYLGLILLIPGTLLGGVWAAESWGRFWDWDPKESWAFISICFYLIGIHAYRYHRIRDFGLSISAICGLLAISFTWYGVNYILGTGLHSYGFGSGGEIYYYGFIFLEIAFIIFMLYIYKSREILKLKKQNSSV